MKVATWNVNSVRARLSHVLQWLSAAQPDALCLQETKVTDDDFPRSDFAEAGWRCAVYGQKSYNGAAIVSRAEPEDVVRGIPSRPDDPQARVIAATIPEVSAGAGSDAGTDAGTESGMVAGTGTEGGVGVGGGGVGVRVISAYVPNGQNPDSEKYDYKLSWLSDFRDYLSEARSAHGCVAAGGDYNIAPADADIYDADAWGEGILATPRERAAFRELLSAGYADAFRLFPQPDGEFSWWDYRQASFRRNIGLRIDHFLLSEELANRAKSCVIDKTPREWPRPSDHAPVVVEF